MIKHCEYCGKEFETKRKTKKYCDYGCYVRDHPDRFPNPVKAINNQKKRYDQVYRGKVKPKPKLRSWRH